LFFKKTCGRKNKAIKQKMEEEITKLVEVAYEEAKKLFPNITRELTREDFRTQDFDRFCSYCNSSHYPIDRFSYEYDEAQRDKIKALNMLEAEGFTNLEPKLREFVKRNGGEYEMRILFQELKRSLSYLKGNFGFEMLQKGREQGIADTMTQYGLKEDSNGWVWIGTQED